MTHDRDPVAPQVPTGPEREQNSLELYRIKTKNSII